MHSKLTRGAASAYFSCAHRCPRKQGLRRLLSNYTVHVMPYSVNGTATRNRLLHNNENIARVHLTVEKLLSLPSTTTAKLDDRMTRIRL